MIKGISVSIVVIALALTLQFYLNDTVESGQFAERESATGSLINIEEFNSSERKSKLIVPRTAIAQLKWAGPRREEF